MSKMKNLYTEAQETAAEEMRAERYSVPEIRRRYITGTRIPDSGDVAHLLAALDEAEATRLEDMRRTTKLLLDVIQAAQYWRERCQG